MLAATNCALWSFFFCEQLERVKAENVELKRHQAQLSNQLEDEVRRLIAASASFDTNTLSNADQLSEQEVSLEDVALLQKTVRELHEMVVFLQRQQELGECRADNAEHKLTHVEEQLEVTRKRLKEARESLEQEIAAREASQSSSAANAAFEAKAKLADTLQESNDQLRAEKSRIAQELATLQTRYDVAKEIADAAVGKENRAAADIEALKQQLTTLQAQRDDWKKRLDRLTSRSEQESSLREADGRIHELQAEVNKLTAQVSQLEADKTEQVAAKEKAESMLADCTKAREALETQLAEAKQQEEVVSGKMKRLVAAFRDLQTKEQAASQSLKDKTAEWDDKAKTAADNLSAKEAELQAVLGQKQKFRTALTQAKMQITRLQQQTKPEGSTTPVQSDNGAAVACQQELDALVRTR